jgi:hypothetical protein
LESRPRKPEAAEAASKLRRVGEGSLAGIIVLLAANASRPHAIGFTHDDAYC